MKEDKTPEREAFEAGYLKGIGDAHCYLLIAKENGFNCASLFKDRMNEGVDEIIKEFVDYVKKIHREGL